MDESQIIGEHTPIKLGAIAGIAIVLISSVWWCSSINTKVDAIMQELQNMSHIENKLTDHEARLKNLESKVK